MVPYVPLSHPFVERLIGTIRRECLDRTLFWTAVDLEMKLLDFQRDYNGHRTHALRVATTGEHGNRRAARVKNYGDVLREYEQHPEITTGAATLPPPHTGVVDGCGPPQPAFQPPKPSRVTDM